MPPDPPSKCVLRTYLYCVEAMEFAETGSKIFLGGACPHTPLVSVCFARTLCNPYVANGISTFYLLPTGLERHKYWGG